MDNIHRDVAGYVMRYDEFKQLCLKAWEEGYNYLCIDRCKKRGQGTYCNYYGSKSTYTECTPETKAFWLT